MSLPAPSDGIIPLLGSLAIHIEEYLSPDGHDADRYAIEGILTHPEVKAWLAELDAFCLLPRKRPA